MKFDRLTSLVPCLLACLIAANVSCKQEDQKRPPTPSMAPLAKSPRDNDGRTADGASGIDMSKLPPGHPPIGGQQAGAMPSGNAQGNDLPPGHPPIGGNQAMGQMGMPATGGESMPAEARIDFDGIRLTPPEGWQAMKPVASGGPMSFTPEAIFDLPKVEGDDDDAQARITHFPGMRNVPIDMNLNRWYGQFRQPDGSSTKDASKLETIEHDGIKATVVDITGTMVDASGETPNYRMIAAVIEHAQGPHFLTVKGPEKTMEHWHDAIVDYVKSAQVIP